MQLSSNIAHLVNAINDEKPGHIEGAIYLRNIASLDEKISALLKIRPERLQNLSGAAIPTGWDDVWRPPNVPPIRKIQQSLNWFLAVAHHYQANLISHCKLARKLYHAVLVGNLNEARLILKKHQSTLGYSLWGMAWFVYLTEEEEGSRGRHEFLDLLGRQKGNENAVFFASTLSLLTDKSLPDDHCVKAVRARINKSTPIVRSFLEIFFLDQAAEKLSITDVLKYFDFVSVIDRYEMFKRMTVLAVSDRSNDAPKCVKTLQWLQEICYSDEIQYLIECFNENATLSLSQPARRLLTGWDHYVNSDYRSCKSVASQLIGTDADLFFSHDLLVKSEIYLNEISSSIVLGSPTSPASIIHDNLRLIYTRSEDTEDALANMLRLATRLRIPTLGWALRSFVASHSTDSIDSRTSLQAAYSFGCHGPRNWEFTLKQSSRLNYLARLSSAEPTSVATRFFYEVEREPEQLANLFPDLDEARIQFFAGISCARHNNDLAAKNFLRDFLSSQKAGTTSPLSPFAVEEARRVLMKSLCSHGDALGLLDLIVEVLLDRSPSFRRISFETPYAICKQAPDLFCHHVGYPILAALANDSAHKISFALRRFLKSVEVKTPTDLIHSQLISNDEKSLLFMRVCTIEVLQSIGDLGSLEALEMERLELLRWVGKNAQRESRAVETEVLRITQQAQLREALDNIDSSRVVLNLPALREAEHERFSNVYYNYRAQKELEIGQDAVNRAKANARSMIGSTIATMSLYYSTSEDLDEAFNRAFWVIREQFIGSAQLGLDACLSARVRHGYVVDQIRRPLVENKLAIIQDSLDDDLIREYWRERLGLSKEDPLMEEVFMVMAAATARTDHLAQEIKNEWIQCVTETRGTQGLFDYRFTDDEMWQLKHREINQEPSFELFLDLIFDRLVERTHTNLKQIRRKIDSELLPNLDSVIKDALANLARLPSLPREALIALQGAYTACRIQIESGISEMKRWFQESRSTLMRDADPSLACRTAVGMAERLNPGHRGRIKHIETTNAFKIKGRFFTSIVHVAHFLLENAIKHSGLASNLLQIELLIQTERNMLIFQARNTMTSVESAADAALAIAAKIKNLAAHLDHAKITREGGSGFSKILSTIIYEFKGLNPAIKCTANGCWLEVTVACHASNIMS